MNFETPIKEAAWAHAKRTFPRECCGLVVQIGLAREFVPCRNLAETKSEFVMHPEDFAAAEDRGDVVAIVHSHCYIAARPSQADLAGCQRSGLPWWILSLPTETETVIYPDGKEIPYREREFVQGVMDCYTLVEDYYRLELNVKMPSRHRYGWVPNFWKQGLDLYREQVFTDFGFERVAMPEKHDLITFNVVSDVANHIAIYLGNNIILHHLLGRLSGEDIYGGYYQKHTCGIYRWRQRC